MFFTKKKQIDSKLLEILRTYSKEISSILNLKSLLKNLLQTFTQLAQVRSGSILLIETNQRTMVVQESLGGDPLMIQFSLKDPFINFLGKMGQKVERSMLLQDPQLIDVKESGLRLMTALHAYILFPLGVEHKVLGLLALGNREYGGKIPEGETDLLEILVNMASLSIHNAMLYDALAKQNLKLSEMAQLKTQFVSTVSHELTTPLNGILGLTQILKDPETSGSLTDDQRRYINMIHDAGEELSDCVHQILDLTRLQSQLGTLKVERLNLKTILYDTHRHLEDLFLQKDLKLRMDLAPQTTVYGDQSQISQVIHSLLENAAKFSKSNAKSLIVVKTQKNGDMLKVGIMDQGIGIEDRVQEVIFDDFRQGDGNITRAYGGTGVGLALAKKIVEHHGGRIWVESKKGLGSQFFFTIPLKPGVLQAPEIGVECA